MGAHIIQCLADPVGRRFQFQQGRILRLAAQPAVIDHQPPRDPLRNRKAQVLLYHRQRQVDARRRAGRGPHAAILDEDAVGIDPAAGEARLQLGGISPVRGGPLAVQQPGRAKRERAGADAGDAAGAAGQAPQHADRLRLRHADGRGGAAHHHQRVDGAARRLAAGHDHAGRTLHQAAVRRDDFKLIMVRLDAVGVVEDGHRPAEVEHVETGIDQEGDAHGRIRGIIVLSATSVRCHLPGRQDG